MLMLMLMLLRFTLRLCLCLQSTLSKPDTLGTRFTVRLRKISSNLIPEHDHVYKDDWTPTLGEILECKREPPNEKDANAVAMTRDGKFVVHVPLIHRLCQSFLGT